MVVSNEPGTASLLPLTSITNPQFALRGFGLGQKIQETQAMSLYKLLYQVVIFKKFNVI